MSRSLRTLRSGFAFTKKHSWEQRRLYPRRHADQRHERNTITGLLTLIGERRERMLDGRVRGVPVVDVQCDEIWGFVAMKEKTRQKKRPDEMGIGDAYRFVGMERTSKFILAWHLGRRCKEDTEEFADKLALATTGRFQKRPVVPPGSRWGGGGRASAACGDAR